MVIKDKPLSSIKADIVHAFLSVSPHDPTHLRGTCHTATGSHCPGWRLRVTTWAPGLGQAAGS